MGFLQNIALPEAYVANENKISFKFRLILFDRISGHSQNIRLTYLMQGQADEIFLAMVWIGHLVQTLIT